MMTMLKMVPNWMTILRIMVAPVIAVLIWLDDVKTGYMPALTLFVLASISDFIDGWMARRLGVVSKLGAMLDPIADKVLIGTCLVSLAHVTEDGWWFILPAIIIMTREFLISGLREFMAGRSVNMPVSVLAKWKTTLQLVAIGFLVGAPVFPSLPMANPIGLALLWAAAFVTAQTGFAYYRGVLEHVDKPSQ
ncbi:MAG: CDP-diacylglycerol--glycerol-3-phosphate 3-phosphatidyltransferase [Pseudomonadota bacterium]|jgi:CDP-diacylglycerol--glycerol-3-phosphate 3-phosphatidyltransferase/cardiolipin synthase|nr:CDP-diacylglycerol--glycerol-3-phosphate 3-phosphatidyltransferase [Pseudomonadota bacterium]|tara:strand:+ start:361 stop:936 length:576 start_codon:yes stop_codon:yes gene_type:complete